VIYGISQLAFFLRLVLEEIGMSGKFFAGFVAALVVVAVAALVFHGGVLSGQDKPALQPADAKPTLPAPHPQTTPVAMCVCPAEPDCVLVMKGSTLFKIEVDGLTIVKQTVLVESEPVVEKAK
jgi:hypothetical protein